MFIEELAFAIAALFYGGLTILGAYVAPVGVLYFTYEFGKNVVRHVELDLNATVFKKKIFLCAVLILLGHLSSSKVFSNICFYEQLGLVEAKYKPLVCMEWANEGYWNMLGDFLYPLRESMKNLDLSVKDLMSDDLR